MQSLKKWKAKTDGACPLLFPTSSGRPRLNFLDRCKAAAERAKLNPDDFWLHKFRATFATRALWAGVDLRTVQSWMGHTDLESTMRYLQASLRRTFGLKSNTGVALFQTTLMVCSSKGAPLRLVLLRLADVLGKGAIAEHGLNAHAMARRSRTAWAGKSTISSR